MLFRSPVAVGPSLRGESADVFDGALVRLLLVHVLEHIVHERAEVGVPGGRFADAVDATELELLRALTVRADGRRGEVRRGRDHVEDSSRWVERRRTTTSRAGLLRTSTASVRARPRGTW